MSVYIHIGHGKTGSSAIQSFLANHQDLLLQQGMLYPDAPMLENARKGEVSSGNGALLLEPEVDLSQCENYLFSSEVLFYHFDNEQALEQLFTKLGEKPTIMFYTRDLFDHYFSTWGQFIKRGGGNKTIDEFVDVYQNFYQKVIDYINLSQTLDFRLIINNYSRHENNIIDNFVASIFGHSNFLPSLENKKINRSLTKSEYIIQMLFNKYYQKPSHQFISDILVNKLPNIESERFVIDEETYNQLLNYNQGAIEQVNQYLGEDERIKIGEYRDVVEGLLGSTESYSFSYEQLELLVKSITGSIPQPDSRFLVSEDADYLRDIALKYEKNELLDLEEADKLMRLALRARPHGSFIERKVEEYNEALKDKHQD